MKVKINRGGYYGEEYNPPTEDFGYLVYKQLDDQGIEGKISMLIDLVCRLVEDKVENKDWTPEEVFDMLKIDYYGEIEIVGNDDG